MTMTLANPNEMRRIDRAAASFHAENPHVMAQLIEIAREARARGVKRIGIKLLFERLRWLAAVRTDGDKYQINNSYTSWYARRIMQVDGLAGLFETRNSPHDPDYHARQPQPGTPGFLASLPVLASIDRRGRVQPATPPDSAPVIGGLLFDL